MTRDVIVQTLQMQFPTLLAVYGFGSRIHGSAQATSDLDLAILVAGYADPVRLWQCAADLANAINCDIDLVDLRAASTVMQYQIITTGQRFWVKDSQAALYETVILSEKTALDEARAGLLADIQLSGKVYE